MSTKLKKGDRVRFVHRVDHFGRIVSDQYISPTTGGVRVQVEWDGTHETNDWDPVFLMPAEQPVSADPDVVRSGSMESRKRSRRYLHKGVLVIEQAGLRKIKPQGKGWN